MSLVLPISTIPNHLVIEILNKLRVKELVLVRRTCHLMDDLVEKNRRKFASRPHLGMQLRIVCYENSIKFSYPYQLSPAMSKWVTIATAYDWNRQIERMFTGISFSKLDLLCDHDREGSIEMYKIIKDLNPTCLEIGQFSVLERYIVPVINNITITGPSDIKFSIDVVPKEYQDKLLTKLANAKNHSLFNLTCYSNILETNIFEKIKDFSKVSFDTTLKGFEWLLWDLYNSKEKITMKSLNVEFKVDKEKSHIPLFPYSSLPPIETLQKASSEENGIYLMILHSCRVGIKETYNEYRKSLIFDIKFLKKK